MLRDFSDEKKAEILDAIDSAETSGFWSGVCDLFDDCFISDKISDYSDDIREYQRLIVDKKNTTREQLDAIFDAVHEIDARYAKKFIAYKDRLRDLIAAVDAAAEVLNPKPVGGGGYALLGPRSEMLAKLAPIGEVAQSEAYYAILRQSKGTDEMILTKYGIAYDGVGYPIASLADIAPKSDGKARITGARTLIHSADLYEGQVSIPEFIVRWFGGDPNAAEYTWSQYNDVIEDGYHVYHSEESNSSFDGALFLVDMFNAWGSASHKYTVNVSLYKNPDGSTSAVLNLTSDKYDEWRQDLPKDTQYRENCKLPDGRIVDLAMTFDQSRALSPYVGSIVTDAEGRFVAVPYLFSGDKVLVGEMGILGGATWTQYTVPLSTYYPDAPEDARNIPVPYDIADQMLRPPSLILDDIYQQILEGMK